MDIYASDWNCKLIENMLRGQGRPWAEHRSHYSWVSICAWRMTCFIDIFVIICMVNNIIYLTILEIRINLRWNAWIQALCTVHANCVRPAKDNETKLQYTLNLYDPQTLMIVGTDILLGLEGKQILDPDTSKSFADEIDALGDNSQWLHL